MGQFFSDVLFPAVGVLALLTLPGSGSMSAVVR